MRIKEEKNEEKSALSLHEGQKLQSNRGDKTHFFGSGRPLTQKLTQNALIKQNNLKGIYVGGIVLFYYIMFYYCKLDLRW